MIPDNLGFIRTACMGHPLVEERLSHGEPTWFFKGKRSFVMLADHHHDDRDAVWIAAAPGIQEALISESPGRYFRPPYVGVRGWVGAYLDVDFDREDITGLIREAYSLVASKK
ncbi:MAG: MmcQ/YjbR family DNA-binding protein [Armatimonadetes bacterium]|nr:MmcQ/YjbR family DNA-binding protein [Armatimonadota bacterium]